MRGGRSGRLISSNFKAAWWLRSPHLQTLWPSLLRPAQALDVAWERLELEDGDFIDLAWRRREGPLVLLIHGLEGSLKSHYAVPLLKALEREDFSTVFMHLRGCGREPNRQARSYHSGASEDLAEVLERLQQRGERPDALIGISLGGNLLLKYLGETGRAALTRTAIAISVPFHLASAVARMQRGFSRLYGRHLLNKLVRSYRRKFTDRPAPLQMPIKRIDSLYQFDQCITAPLNGFASADDYYRRCSCIGFLKGIEIPTLILHAADDPLMRPDVIPDIGDLGPGVTLELCAQGGHVGFIEGRLPGRPRYWLEQRIPAYLHQQLSV
ncbi:MAG: hydrolase [Chromatiales bacterium]|jgi:predicted alpha/beta-fold hydrolase